MITACSGRSAVARTAVASAIVASRRAAIVRSEGSATARSKR
jgi:hypothetical protein